VESSIFKRVFPTVPIIGGFCGGEIGVNFIPSGSSEPKLQPVNAKKPRLDRVWRDRELRHSFTTVLVMLSYN